MDSFKDFVLKVYAHQKREYKPKLILAFDPGETTGLACMYDCRLIGYGQLMTKPDSISDCWNRLENAFVYWAGNAIHFDCPYEVSCEDYRVYAHKAESHKWSEVHTIKIVSLIQLMTAQRCKYAPIRMRMAAAAKSFVTDDKLKAWGFYEDTKGERHARDAVRHACFHQCFPPAEDAQFMPKAKSSTGIDKKPVDKTAERVKQGKSIF